MTPRKLENARRNYELAKSKALCKYRRAIASVSAAISSAEKNLTRDFAAAEAKFDRATDTDERGMWIK
jgi:hypothetical protein